MNDPWTAREDDARPEPSVNTFIIFCEDMVSEPEYFKSFQKDHLSVRVFEGQKKKKLNVDKAIAHCMENGLLKWDGKKYVAMFDDGFQVWCVFDRDKARGNEAEILDDAGFYSSIQSAEAHSIKVAWSNDAFELWVLLHIQEVNPEDPDYKHRDKYYERLVDYFKNIQNPSAELERKRSHASFSYDDLKQRKVFISIIPVLKAATSDAIKRAKQLEAFHKDKPHHEKTPCTLVHHLVLELIEKGKE